MTFQITKATKIQSKARIGLIGPAGSGKTYSALLIAQALGQRIAVIDTENASAAKYAGLVDFDVLTLDTFAPKTYVEAVHAIEDAHYDVLIIDSLSHAWMGKGGALEMVDNAGRRSGGNGFAAWRDVTPEHNKLVDALVRCRCHLIVTMRSKMEYILDRDEKTGKTAPRKVGMAPVQRDGLEYEFDIAGDIDLSHRWIITKTRCPALDGLAIDKPGAEIGRTIAAWLAEGSVAPQPPPPAQQPAPTNGKRPTRDHVDMAHDSAISGGNGDPRESYPPATDKQRGFIAGLMERMDWSSEQLAAYASEQGYDLVTMTTSQASMFIDGLKVLAEERTDTKAKANGKKRPPTREEIADRLTATFDEAIGLGIAVEDTTIAGKTDAELIAVGQQLRAIIDQAKRKAAMQEEAEVPA